eukprot:UN05833
MYNGHGSKDYIISSDYQFIKKDALYRLFDSTHPKLMEIPRIIIFDCDDETVLPVPVPVTSDSTQDSEYKFNEQETNLVVTVKTDHAILNEQDCFCGTLVYDFWLLLMTNDRFKRCLGDIVKQMEKRLDKQTVIASFDDDTKNITFEKN